uniref:oxidized low-density lipoprotein receptor 1 n=1 Tax=Jaculus jaculus TaxID=51337 RepID=UPI001E1B4AB2
LAFLSSPWWFPVAMTLGVICLGLLVTIIVLETRLFQVSNLLKQYGGNLTQQENVLQGQILAQQQAENASQMSQRELRDAIETLSQQLHEKSQKQMELHQHNLHLQEALQKVANFSGPCPQGWIWHGEDCYAFSSGPLDWGKSRENCLLLNAQLLKINSTDDLDFIQRAIAHSSSPFWVGLSLRKPNRSWLWEDGSPLKPRLFRLQGGSSQTHSRTCAYLQQGVVFAENCILAAFSICQKKADLWRSQPIGRI